MLWGDHVVCASCYRSLSAGLPRYPAPSTYQMVAPPTTTMPEVVEPVDDLAQVAAAAATTHVVARRTSTRYVPASRTSKLPWVIAAVAVFVIGGLALLMFKSGKSPAALLAPSPGKVHFTVTWKYNDFVGDKPDTGAVVALLPKDLRERLSSGGVLPNIADQFIDKTRKDFADHGAYVAIIGGDGKAMISGVKPGAYNVVILSRNTDDSDENSEIAKAKMESFFYSGSAAVLCKCYFSEVQVPAGDDTEINHDFGITYYGLNRRH